MRLKTIWKIAGIAFGCLFFVVANIPFIVDGLLRWSQWLAVAFPVVQDGLAAYCLMGVGTVVIAVTLGWWWWDYQAHQRLLALGAATTANTPLSTAAPPIAPTAKETGGTAISTITPRSIMEAINAAIPLERQDRRKRYEGVPVVWRCALANATNVDGGRVRLQTTQRGAIVFFEVKRSDYPGLGLLKSGAEIKVEGVISEVTSGWIDLKDARLEFQV